MCTTGHVSLHTMSHSPQIVTSGTIYGTTMNEFLAKETYIGAKGGPLHITCNDITMWRLIHTPVTVVIMPQGNCIL